MIQNHHHFLIYLIAYSTYIYPFLFPSNVDLFLVVLQLALQSFQTFQKLLKVRICTFAKLLFCIDIIEPLHLQSLKVTHCNDYFQPFTWIVPGVLMGGEKRKAEKARLTAHTDTQNTYIYCNGSELDFWWLFKCKSIVSYITDPFRIDYYRITAN